MEKKLLHGAVFKRVVSLAMTLVMLLSFFPGVIPARAATEDTMLYLKPNANWLSDNARFAVYYWNDGGSAWLDLADENKDGYYEVAFPSGYSKLIFCRMNPATTENKWENKWNQTADLTLTDGYNCCVIADEAWDGAGEWDTFIPEEEEPVIPESSEPPAEPADSYYVAGDSSLCGSNWSENDSNNKMTHVSNGVYEKVYTNVAAGTYNLKVTNGTWDKNWGDNGNNYTFVVSATCDVTVSFDANSQTVSVTGEHVGKETGLEINTMHAVGNGSGNWLGGKNWEVTANTMTEISDNVYEITFEDVPEGSAYEFKFAANAAWTHSWGGGGAEGEAVYNGQNIKLTVSYALADVTLKLDMTGYNHDTKTGAVYSVTVTEVEAEPAVDYYLVGYINGADYGCNDDYANLGAYKFVDGKLTATFEQDSYVFVKTGDNANWYMSEGYAANSPATLYNTTVGLTDANKLFVPGGKELTFTLVVNADDTLTLSYTASGTEVPEDYTTVTIHFLKPEGWGNTINAYLWNNGAVPGYEDYNTWPGKAVSANAEHAGWYDLVVSTEQPMAFNFIFNDGGNQTADLYTGSITGDTELWVVGNNVLTTAPGEWSGDYTYTANIHFRKPADWADTINAWIWNDNGAIPGYEQYQTTWPGAPIEADAVNSGWYNVSVTVDENSGFSFILNDGSKQTADLSTGTLDVITHLWVVDGQVQHSAPDGWVDASRTVHVPGTFPGPSWDAGSNQMTYDADLGLYVYTFEDVPAANYEYKISINKSWNENYGAGGVKDGANMSVSVPETMDVTVYYNDRSHFSTTSVTYIFADIALSGTGIPEGTKLKDNDLSGIYSASVDMAAGTYTDVKLTYNGKDYLMQLQQRESERTGIPSLKISFNNVFGYYIEVRNTYKENVPADWIRKQTLVNAERYITQELKEYEEKILGAEEKILALESQIYNNLVADLASYIPAIQVNASHLARLDVLLSFANISRTYKYIRPVISEDDVLDIKQGRHPVIERQMAVGESYIPNDLYLDSDKQQIIIVTGPNMAGKSALLRQTALITLMAQIGCFVPADSAVIGLVDKIFTRVGASDNISAGESTFMVEMTEASNILNNLSGHSLVLFDELGRGTSTYDGMSIAWAIVEYIHEYAKGRARTLFATHYHELTVLESLMEGVKNYNIAVKKRGDDITFLRKIVKGGADESYGIEVAKLAGIPESIIRRAKDILKELTLAEPSDTNAQAGKADIIDNGQLSLLNPVNDAITEKLNKVDINTLTPIEAINLIYELKKLL